jgi:hypothetical protein
MGKGLTPFWDVPVVTQEEAEANPDPQHMRIVIPKGSEAERVYADAIKGKVCGHCRHFRLREGQEEFRDQKLFETLFDKLAMNHNQEWYGRLDIFGLCAYWDGHMTNAYAPRRVPKHFVSSNCTYLDKDEATECPQWEERGTGQASTPHYAGKKRNYEE